MPCELYVTAHRTWSSFINNIGIWEINSFLELCKYHSHIRWLIFNYYGIFIIRYSRRTVFCCFLERLLNEIVSLVFILKIEKNIQFHIFGFWRIVPNAFETTEIDNKRNLDIDLMQLNCSLHQNGFYFSENVYFSEQKLYLSSSYIHYTPRTAYVVWKYVFFRFICIHQVCVYIFIEVNKRQEFLDFSLFHSFTATKTSIYDRYILPISRGKKSGIIDDVFGSIDGTDKQRHAWRFEDKIRNWNPNGSQMSKREKK